MESSSLPSSFSVDLQMTHWLGLMTKAVVTVTWLEGDDGGNKIGEVRVVKVGLCGGGGNKG